jgi:hypothetical protein
MLADDDTQCDVEKILKHVVVVVDGPLAHGKYPTAYWGSLHGIGKKISL